MGTFKCGHELTRENTTPRGRCRECWNAYHRAYQTGPRGQRPEDLPPENLAELAKTRNKTMLRQHYGVGEDRLNKWLRVSGVEAAKNLCIRRRHVPDDFAELAAVMTQARIAIHYKVDTTTVKRWKEETGIETAAPTYQRPVHQPRRGHIVFRGHAAAPVHRDLRPSSIHDDAADILRRWFVCFRCGPTGKYLEKGLHWRVGNVICTPAELMERAEAKKARAA